MASFRHQLTAYSPLSITGLAAAVSAVLRNPPDELESARRLLGTMFHAAHVSLVDSGRSALQLAISIATQAQSSDLVALPAFSCFEVAAAAVGVGCRVTLYDLDPQTLGPDLNSLEAALRRGAGVVVVAPLYGLPVDWSAVTSLVERHGAVAIEDAAQGHGAEWHDRALGTLGALSVISFGRGKGWSAAGGGALLGRGRFAAVDSYLRPLREASRTASARTAVMAVAQRFIGHPAVYAIPASIPGLGLGETHYHPPTPPTQMPPISASLLQRTMRASANEAEIRRRNAATWQRALPREVVSRITEASGGRAGYLRFPVRLPRGGGRLEDARRLGVAASYPAPLHTVSALGAQLIDGASVFPGAAVLAEELATLPTHSLVSSSDRAAIVAFVEAWRSRVWFGSLAPSAT